MKHRIYSLAILALGLLVLAGCSDDNMMSAPRIEDQAVAQTYILDDTVEPGRGVSFPVTIGSDNDSQTGYLMVSNDAQNLYLSFYMIGSWRLKDSYIHIGRSQDEIPVDEAGRPIKDRFQFGFDLERGMTSHKHIIPLSEIRATPGQMIVISSYATVYKEDGTQNNITREGLGSSWWFSTDYRIRRPGIGDDITADRDVIAKQVKVEN